MEEWRKLTGNDTHSILAPTRLTLRATAGIDPGAPGGQTRIHTEPIRSATASPRESPARGAAPRVRDICAAGQVISKP